MAQMALIYFRNVAHYFFLLLGASGALVVMLELLFVLVPSIPAGLRKCAWLVPSWAVLLASLVFLCPDQSRELAVRGTVPYSVYVSRGWMQSLPESRPNLFILLLFTSYILEIVLICLVLLLLFLAKRRVRSLRPTRHAEIQKVFNQLRDEYGLSRVICCRGGLASPPSIFGVKTFRISLPDIAEVWDKWWIFIVLRHELVHAKRRDQLLFLSALLPCLLLPFNPFSWWAIYRFCREAEPAVDDEVTQCEGKEAYIAVLEGVKKACENSRFVEKLWSFGGVISLHSRIKRLNNPRISHTVPSTSSRILFVATMGVFVVTSFTLWLVIGPITEVRFKHLPIDVRIISIYPPGYLRTCNPPGTWGTTRVDVGSVFFISQPHPPYAIIRTQENQLYIEGPTLTNRIHPRFHEDRPQLFGRKIDALFDLLVNADVKRMQ